MSALREWLSERSSAVRLRQLADRLRHRLSFVPGLYVLGAIVLSQLLLVLDRALGSHDLPDVVATTLPSARALFTAIAGGLITSITLLLSMMLVTVQLASSQYSPRTLRDWLADRLLQQTIGVALGTTVFSLMALRSTGSPSEGSGDVVPHTTVVVAVALGIGSLFFVVRSVDHITDSLRVGSVAKRIADETVAVIRAQADTHRPKPHTSVPPSLGTSPAVGVRPDEQLDDVPADAVPIEAPTAGWIQQIDTGSILSELPTDTVAHVVVPLGSYVAEHTPIMWVSPPPPDDHDCFEHLLRGFAFGDTRTMQQDVGYGLMQLTDIAVRALSPGVNDPGTANDVIVHLGHVLLELWTQPPPPMTIREDGRIVVRRQPGHAEHLRRAVDPIRRYGASDPLVTATLVRTLHTLRSESVRRNLAGPIEPLTAMIHAIAATSNRALWSESEAIEVDELLAATAEKLPSGPSPSSSAQTPDDPMDR